MTGEALDRTQWRTGFGRGFGPVVRQTMEWMNEWIPKTELYSTAGFSSRVDFFPYPSNGTTSRFQRTTGLILSPPSALVKVFSMQLAGQRYWPFRNLLPKTKISYSNFAAVIWNSFNLSSNNSYLNFPWQWLWRFMTSALWCRVDW